MSGRTFVDASVLVRLFDDDEPQAQAAARKGQAAAGSSQQSTKPIRRLPSHQASNQQAATAKGAGGKGETLRHLNLLAKYR